jgi:hypothetical protein
MEFIATPAPAPLAYRLQDALLVDKSPFGAWVEAATAAFETRLPVPASCDLFRSEGFFRLKHHLRSICFAPSGEVGNVICIKGLEPFAPDFGVALDRLAAQRRADSGLSLFEHFILTEDKLPACVLFDEAIAEATTAAQVHLRLAGDGEPLPRLPLPVLCVRLPQATLDAAVSAISARARPSLLPKIETLAAVGLGAYVYWYPSLPLRVADFRTGAGSAADLSDRWIGLAARLLRAGFLPTSAHALGRGQCCNRQNSVIDGGFVDLGSVIPIVSVRTQQDLFTAVQLTIWEISATILHVMGRPLRRDGSSVGRLDYAALMVMQMVRERLAHACGEGVDPRLRQFFSATETVQSLCAILEPP